MVRVGHKNQQSLYTERIRMEQERDYLLDHTCEEPG